MHDCMKRRLLYAASQAYHPDMETVTRSVGWIEKPIVVQRTIEFWHRPIDLALVGRTHDGVVVAFRGSLPPFFGGRHDGWAVLLDWLNDGLALCRADADYRGAGVHWGFGESMRRLWHDADGTPGVQRAVQTLLDRGAPRHLFVTGHSKGGALANLAAYRAARLAAWRDMPVSVATIAAARVGNHDFAQAYAEERIACLRYELASDPIPHLPLGPASPRWARQLARRVWPGLAPGVYQPVGTAVTGAARARPGGALRDLLARTDLNALTPAMLASHSICPDSGYDRLVCHGEAECSHGRATPTPAAAAAAPRRHDRDGTRSPEPLRRRDIRGAAAGAPAPDPKAAKQVGARRD